MEQQIRIKQQRRKSKLEMRLYYLQSISDYFFFIAA